MYNKIVDTVVASSRHKPLSGGKCENWWLENSSSYHGLNRKSSNRNAAGQKDSELSPSVEETLMDCKFKGFEFGNWMSQAERYDVFRAFQVCIKDMCRWLNTQNIGFDHQIGVAFGARGSGRFAAHFEPFYNVINMTKEYGAGSFLHEYAHAIDYNIGAFLDQNAKYSALSGGRSMKQSPDNVGCQFRAMMNKILNYVRSTESFSKLKKKTIDSDYWCNSTELFARLTEAYYAYYFNKDNNHYLVKPVRYYEEDNKNSGKYLSKAEMDVIKPELDKFWKEVGLLLNDKCKLVATPFPTSEKKAAKLKDPIKLKVSKYSIEYRVYTDKTFKKVKKVERSKVILENKPLDTLLEHLNRIEANTKADIVDKRKNTFISRTQYSIRYLTFQGEYYEEVIVDSNGNRLKEKKAPAPKKKDKKQKPIQF